MDADADDDPPWMVTAFIEGPSLERLVAHGGPLSVPALRALGAGLAEGLRAIHKTGLIHRDVKPSNVIMGSDGPRLIDFGIARVAGWGTVSAPGDIIGTFAYMSPEQERGEPAKQASDVFALGSTLVFAATGHPAFPGETNEAVRLRIRHGEPELSDLPADRELRSLIMQCLAGHPDGRPTTSDIVTRLSLEPNGPAEEGDLAPTVRIRRNRAQAGAARWRLPQLTRDNIWPVAVGGIILAGVAAVLVNMSMASAAWPPPGAPLGPVTLAGVYSDKEYGFTTPTDIAVRGNAVWVTNIYGDSVTELNASTGGWVQTIGGSSYGFREPSGIVDDGSHIWVTDTAGNSVKELSASDGSLIQTLSGGEYGFDQPGAIIDDGTHLWIGNYGGSVTELQASDGTFVQTLRDSRYQFNYPIDLAADGTHIWITNFGRYKPDYSVTEVNASDGSLVRVLSGPQYRFNQPSGIAVAGAHIWITNPNGNTVTEVSATTGAVENVLSGSEYHFGRPSGLALADANLFVTSISGDSVDVVNADTGALEKVISGKRYAFDDPNAIRIADSQVWIGNWLSAGGTGSVTELRIG